MLRIGGTAPVAAKQNLSTTRERLTNHLPGSFDVRQCRVE